MDKTKNYYEILGLDEDKTSYILLEKSALKSKREIVEKAYNDRKACLKNEFDKKMGILKRGELNNSNPEKLRQVRENMEKINKQFEEAMKELSIAYRTIKNEVSRKLYNDELLKESRNRERPLIAETAYEFFNISEQELKSSLATENDLLIRKKFDSKTENYKSELKAKNLTFKKKQEIETLILKAKEFYELIATAEKRKVYNKNLEEKEKEAKNNIRRGKLKVKYSKRDQYDENLIETIKEGEFLGEKLVVRKETKKSRYILLQNTQEGCDIRIRRTAGIAFENSSNITSYVDEYEVIKVVGGKEKVDTIYTLLSFPKLAINRDTGEPVNHQYYECVANKLLATETIEGSKYNDGYIGMIEKTKEGGYDITLDKGKLDPIEQENLTAVMIVKKRREKNKGVKREGESK